MCTQRAVQTNFDPISRFPLALHLSSSSLPRCRSKEFIFVKPKLTRLITCLCTIIRQPTRSLVSPDPETKGSHLEAATAAFRST